MAKKLILTNEEKSALITDYKRGDSLRSLEKNIIMIEKYSLTS